MFGSVGEGIYPVGKKEANFWGLYDTLGNVWEWTLDWHTNSLGTAEVTDPLGPVSGTKRTLRGGSTGCASSVATPSYRYFDEPEDSAARGFRIVRRLR